jgi:hypothetical protein
MSVRCRTLNGVTLSAPRYDARIVDAVRRLDDERVSMAETCRRVGDVAVALGLPRPSTVHLRRLVRAERERAREIDGLLESLASEALSGRAPRLLAANARVREAELRARLRRTSP